MKKKFLRRDSARHSQFGKRRKKLLKWKRPTGRDNKMREKRRGYPVVVSIGYAQDKKNKKIQIKIIRNILDLEKVKKGDKLIIGKIGMRNKIEILKKADSRNLEFENINIKKFLIKINKKTNKNESK
jgi:large subunit ribosomal protein L32e